jgi:hypothetical protein
MILLGRLWERSDGQEVWKVQQEHTLNIEGIELRDPERKFKNESQSLVKMEIEEKLCERKDICLIYLEEYLLKILLWESEGKLIQWVMIDFS